MSMTETTRYRIVQLYCLIHLALLFFKFFTNGFLFQVTPSFFFHKLDFTTWLVMLTGLQKVFLNNPAACFTADLIQGVLPFAYLAVYKKNKKLSSAIAVLYVPISFIYITIYCSYPSTDSLQPHIATLLFPLAFIPPSLRTFWFILQGLRYYFLLIFASAGIWKIVHGGLFSIEQLSGILTLHHRELLASSSGHPQVDLYQWLIVHPSFSYLLFLAATLTQLSLLTGLFTKKYDKVLVLLFVSFLVLDLLIMRLDYWETLPVVLTLLYSKYQFPGKHCPVENAVRTHFARTS